MTPYKCPVCGQTFWLLILLSQHVKVSHPGWKKEGKLRGTYGRAGHPGMTWETGRRCENATA